MSPDPVIPLAGPVAGIAAHKHCEVCGKAMALDGRVCSPECQGKALEAFRTRKRSVYVFVAAIALVLLFSVYGGKLIGL
ncbi:MAG TPA: DUF2116 family Zn-ribbon domain-containing protein [Candidatus Thermoplasmatota archaeon]|nr:DUF2116 family Zn-ribbon domain-containing protein [Candidatus Thermoplasmatota archaeon]